MEGPLCPAAVEYASPSRGSCPRESLFNFGIYFECELAAGFTRIGRLFCCAAGRGLCGFLRLNIHFNFRAETHSSVAVSVRPSVHQPRAAMCLVRFPARYFRGHLQCRFDRHAHLQRRRSNKEKSASRNIRGFREVLHLRRRQPYRTKSQRDTYPKALQMSAFRRGHLILRAGFGDTASPAVSLGH